MFGLLSKVTGFVLGLGGNQQNDESSTTFPRDNETGCATKHQQIVAPKAEPKPEDLRKSFYGKVSRLYDGAGVIDDDVYFTLDVVVGGFRPELGCEVHVEAIRESLSSGWKATRVDHVQEWDIEGRSGSLETVIAMVTGINGDILTLNDERTIDMSALHHTLQTYYPFVGDWIKADLEKYPDESSEIRDVKPLREKNFTGKVSCAFPGYGYIDETVYFTVGACVRGYTPRRGDDVQVTAVESRQGRSNWRAILIEPKHMSSRLRSPSAGSQQFMGGKMAELLSNKNGIIIKDTPGFGDVPMGETRTIHLEVRNTGEIAHKFLRCSFLRSDSQFDISQTNNYKSQVPTGAYLVIGMDMQPGQTSYVPVTFTGKSLGRITQLLVLCFEGFEIGKSITCNVLDSTQSFLKPTTPYRGNKGKGRQTWNRLTEHRTGEDWIIPGERPTRKVKIFLPVKLKMYEIPSDIRRCILDDRDLGSIVPALRQPLTLQTYQARFSALLNAEELQMELEMREFDMEGVAMDLHGNDALCLCVPGLAEGRPSLLIGDTVLVSLVSSAHDAPKYQGYVHEVHRDDIVLRFNEEFHRTYGLEKCNVMFFFNRSSIRRAHQAAEFAVQMGKRVLFPSQFTPKLPVVSLAFGSDPKQTEDASKKTPIKATDLHKPSKVVKTVDFLYNSHLNERQHAAVSRILSGQCRPTSYLLFGPPGTGKTVTLVEAILQVFHRIPASRTIACAPSNSASDLMAVRLHRSGFIQEGDMIRLNAFQRAQEIPESISKYCTDTDSLQLAAHYRIIVCTCSTAGQLFSLGLRPGHFTHVFVDEAGQATEPECLIPVGLAAGEDGQIILAGDPFQLGPVLRSQVAISYGLNTSLLERLMSRPLYRRDETRFADHGCYDPLLVTKLVNNYRSHPSLLRLPSALFYHSELRVCADRTMREELSEWEMLIRKGTPLIFHGLKGEDLREGNSPSWFNPVEAVQVVRYVQGLKSSSTCPIKLTDIGVITPYKKQVEKIRLLLRRLGLDDVKVGSVEEFQGQERPAIIISTVRSNESLVGFDVQHTIGFLSNPKRFNVAITRAQALLIVVGNPHVLCRDPYWCSLLQYCVMCDVYTGCELPDLDTQEEEFRFAMEVMSRLSLDSEGESDSSIHANSDVLSGPCGGVSLLPGSNNKSHISNNDTGQPQTMEVKTLPDMGQYKDTNRETLSQSDLKITKDEITVPSTTSDTKRVHSDTENCASSLDVELITKKGYSFDSVATCEGARSRYVQDSRVGQSIKTSATSKASNSHKTYNKMVNQQMLWHPRKGSRNKCKEKQESPSGMSEIPGHVDDDSTIAYRRIDVNELFSSATQPRLPADTHTSFTGELPSSQRSSCASTTARKLGTREDFQEQSDDEDDLEEFLLSP